VDQGNIGIVGTAIAAVSAAGLWLTGETGRIMVAGGLGGLTRWLANEKRRARDGALAMLGGVVTGHYMWPIGLHLPRIIGGDPFPETPSNIALAAFIVGTMGVSAVKIITAVVEQRASAMTRNGDDGQS